MAKSSIDNNTHLKSQHKRMASGESVTGQTLKAGGVVKGRKVTDKDSDKMAKGGCVGLKKGGKC